MFNFRNCNNWPCYRRPQYPVNDFTASLLSLIGVTVVHRQLGRWLYYQTSWCQQGDYQNQTCFCWPICINQLLAEALVLVLIICHNFEGLYEIRLIEVAVCIMSFCPVGLAQFKQRFAPRWIGYHGGDNICHAEENPSLGWTWNKIDRVLPLDPRSCAHLAIYP